MDIGAPELLIILAIILLLFGVGRLAKIGGELGRGIREFRRGLQGDEEKQPGVEPEPADPTPQQENKDREKTLEDTGR